MIAARHTWLIIDWLPALKTDWVCKGLSLLPAGGMKVFDCVFADQLFWPAWFRTIVPNRSSGT